MEGTARLAYGNCGMALLENWKCQRFQPVRMAQLRGNFSPWPQLQGHGEGCEALQTLDTLLTALLPQSGSKIYDSEFMMLWV